MLPRDDAPLWDIRAGVFHFEFNRPDQLNALDLASARRLRAAVECAAASRDVTALVITGAGRAFCAGGDVREMLAAGDRTDYLRRLTDEVHSALLTISALPIPVVTAVHGMVAGGGVGIMLAGDWIIADAETRFVSGYGAIGVTPDCGVTVRLPRSVGAVRAGRFLLDTTPLTAADALDWGLVSELAGAGELGARVDRRLESLGGIGAEVVAETRRLVRGETEGYLRSALADEAATIARLAGSERAGDLMTRFVAKRS